MLLFIPLALCAAFLLASSAALQQRAAGRSRFAARDDRTHALPGMGHLVDLAREPMWLLGWLTNVAGFFTQALALHLGSLAEVQPLMVTQLLFALPLGLVRTHLRMARGAWWAVASICAGLALLLTVQGRLPAHAPLDEYRLALTILAIIALAATLTVFSRGRRPAMRAAMLGVGAGLFFALSALLMKQATDETLNEGIATTATHWFAYALCGVTMASLVFGQMAFAVGPLAPTVTAMNITNPTVSYTLAVLVFGVPAPDTPGVITGVTVAALLVVGGVVLLARSPALPRPTRRLPDVSRHDAPAPMPPS
ncbi:hypothetical protein ThrDRAFT_02613 [Frankia casuarinae]|uniref:Integral membrane protein n=2 Tax=Frankia casuarinae (strain DSM 45818 / CECT 9043 / HFP020203 / CcI3) TaxID=106370 RepID=Q2J8Y4_FRACC|nr:MULTISPECIES: DMT family transporter [Frankia]ABD12258.1 putative integral membrane protein [Frankia casuarinae]ETA01717.1 hypothetical protein CcI6DRAFT_02897 [Frankia sp. CcI6]EYT91726.1 hypothetical protein ThrDRAFT_02613 [Frankia casuarinae]KDA42392.1 hypothetical protein BMG523Draft_02783 [Frankia sp. BMG5.23]KEZ35113.1 hypothetical protein CEDDRAFT_03524 [Frankia sp. CeD]